MRPKEGADIDDEGAGDELDVGPLAAGGPPDVEPANVVLVQDGQRPEVLVPPHAQRELRARAPKDKVAREMRGRG